jgi:hypothetical protein
MFLKTIRSILVITLSVICGIAVGQRRDTTLTQEVEVVKSFRPTISDANKISSMPRIEDAQHEKPSFNYNIFSQPIFNTFSVNTLKAAAFSSPPHEDTGFGLVRAGVGNYYRPYGEIFFNSRRSRNSLIGLHGKHLSSHGKLNLESGDRVKAPFSDNEAEMFLKHLYRNSVLSVNLGFNHNGFNYYGYAVDSLPQLLKEEGQEINYFGNRQTFTKGSFNINLENAAARNNDITFDFDFLYHYFGAKTGQREHFGHFIADVKKPAYNGTGFLKAGLTYVNTDQTVDQYQMTFGRNQIVPAKNSQTILTAQPAYMIGGEMANLRVGLNTWFIIDSSNDFVAKMAPDIRANLVPVKEIINIFAGIDGKLIHNHYSKIAYENPFVDPEHLVKNSFERFRIYGGFDGKLSPKTNFKLSVDYSLIKDQPLYYLFKYQEEGQVIVDNDFDVFYDNLDQIKFNLEIFHLAFNKMNMVLSGNYYVYKMETMEQAWNLPDWDGKFSLAYQVSDQLSLSADMFFTGQRKALIMGVPLNDPRPLAHRELLDPQRPLNEFLQMESYSLPTVFDLNFNANYKVTDQFTIFAQLNNFGFQQYQRWLGYPVQKFNFLGGLSYAF